MLACDFFVVVTATFRIFYVFVVLEVGTRRIRHWNVTEHPTAEWTAQQFRMVMLGDERHRFLIHDRDSIYSDCVDRTIAGVRTQALAPAFRMLPTWRRCRPAIESATVTGSSPHRFSAVFIISTISNCELPEH